MNLNSILSGNNMMIVTMENRQSTNRFRNIA